MASRDEFNSEHIRNDTVYFDYSSDSKHVEHIEHGNYSDYIYYGDYLEHDGHLTFSNHTDHSEYDNSEHDILDHHGDHGNFSEHENGEHYYGDHSEHENHELSQDHGAHSEHDLHDNHGDHSEHDLHDDHGNHSEHDLHDDHSDHSEHDLHDDHGHHSEHGHHHHDALEWNPEFNLTSTYVHIICVLFFVIICLIENIVVIYLYTKSKSPYSGNAFVIALAVIDIATCVLLVPIFPFMSWLQHENDILVEIVFVTIDSILLSYLLILVAMALERVWAVIRPFTFSPSQCRNVVCILIIVISVFLGMFFSKFVLDGLVGQSNFIAHVAVIATIAMSFLILMISYPAIAIRLYAQSSKVGTMPAAGSSTRATKSTATGNKTMETSVEPETSKAPTRTQSHKVDDSVTRNNAAASQQTNTMKARRKNHIKTAQMFGAITLLYVLSYVPVLIVVTNVSKNFHVLYAYLINHVGNPIIYYVLNSQFRKDVQQLWTKIRNR